jgi:hypothetical protein
MSRHNIIIKQNTTYDLSFSVSQSGAAMDLTEYTVKSSIKKDYDQNSKVYVTMSLLSVLNTTGSIDLRIPPEITKTIPVGSYYYDVLLSGSKEYRILEGVATVTPFVTS